jgi:putative chitinase
MQLDTGTLRRLWPRAPQALVDGVVAHAPATFARYGLTTPLRVAHFMAQISHESGGGTITAENLNYASAERIAAVWPKRFTPASARPYVHNPHGLADRVYNGRMGNAPGSDDGFNYRGRGLLQITGRASYRRIGSLVSVDLENRPELAAAPSIALDIAACEFKQLGCLPHADRDDVQAVTYRVNGGYNGLQSRKAWLAKWKAVHLAAESPSISPPQSGSAEDEAPPPVDIPRGSDDRLPPPAPPVTRDSSAWAGVLATIAAIGGYLGQAVDAVKPLLSDPHTIGFAIGVVLIAGAVILYESHKRATNV